MSDLDRITTANELGIYLYNLAEARVTTYEELDDFKGKINAIVKKIEQNPALAAPFALDALEYLAARSPFKDIAEGVFHHQQDPRQDACFHAIRTFTSIAFVAPAASAYAVSRLENLAMTNEDWDIRREAVMNIWVMGDVENYKIDEAADALERIAKTNSDAYIRTGARDNLLSIGQDKPEFLPVVIRALEEGTKDTNIEAKTRVLGLLGNLVQTCTNLSEDQMKHLAPIFSRAATEAEAAIKQQQLMRDVAQDAQAKAEARLAKPGHLAPYPYPRR